jgi:toxin ParE1/3/4
MEVKIEWSELAEIQLREIYDYYSLNASQRVSRRIINGIIERVDVLLTNPLIGAKEELLSGYSQDFRYLIAGNYKLIYWKEGDSITIASVFDCRQNPVKIKNIST